MNKFLITFFLPTFISLAMSASAQTAFVTERRLAAMADDEQARNPLALWPLEMGVEPGLPDASLADFSFLLKPPAGRDGATTVTLDGHFASARTGERRRFWGVSLGLAQVDIPTWQIGAFVESLARNGVNLVRFTGLDAPGPRSLAGPRLGGPGGDSQSPHPEVLNRFDYWVASCKEHGIYVAVRLLDQRQFGERDGVEGAAALPAGGGPAALFDERLIDLQKQFARTLLREHVNPYLGRPLGDDPALAWVELMAPTNFLVQSWIQLPEPYQSQLRIKWNIWLRDKYSTTDKLYKAWTNSAGESALHSGESLEDNSIELPHSPMRTIKENDYTHPDGYINAATFRANDALEFAQFIQNNFAQDLNQAMKEMNINSPRPVLGISYAYLGGDDSNFMTMMLTDLIIDESAKMETQLKISTPGLFDNDGVHDTEPTTASIISAAANPKLKPTQEDIISSIAPYKPYIVALTMSGNGMGFDRDISKLYQHIGRFAISQVDGMLIDCTVWPSALILPGNISPKTEYWRELGMVGAFFTQGGFDPSNITPQSRYMLWPENSDSLRTDQTSQEINLSSIKALRWENAADIEYAAAVALDGRPLDYSRKIYVRGKCYGPDEPLAQDTATSVSYLLGDSISRLPARLMRGETQLLGVGAGAGAWEALLDLDAKIAYIRADELGAAFELGEKITAARECFLDVPSRPLKVESDKRVTWPGGGLYLEVRW